MNTVFFKGKDEKVSSLRVGNKSLKLTNHFGSSQGGMTFKNKDIISRLNNKGQCIGFGLRSGENSIYFGKNGSMTDRITPFR